ncbi:MAG TPA: hypothetical protein VFB66_31255 [Tepidisphaeraceae bacterium]|nr:hypothetical protein [Tepidisphaeraceae bacterium]
MAKMFYTLEEAKGALGKSEDEIKQFAREGRLREFRDGPRLMFKADQVEQLRSELGAGGDTVDLGVSDSGGMIGLVDTTGASGTSITLAESDTGMGTGAGMSLSEDTSGGPDIGLSGSLGGVPSPTRGGTGGGTGIPLAGSVAGGTGIPLAGSMAGGTAAGTGIPLAGTGAGLTSGGTAAGVSASGLSGSMAGRSRGGINVFGTEDVGFADPSAQTAISNAAARDASVNLETVGSGSGLLDLTRESDDTSLGAVLDEIGPAGATRAAPAMGTDMGAAAMHDLHEPAVDRRPVAAPVMVQALDSTAPAFGAASLAGFAAMLFGAFVLISALVGAIPRETVEWLTSLGLFIVAAMGIGAALLLFALGWVVGKSVRA